MTLSKIDFVKPQPVRSMPAQTGRPGEGGAAFSKLVGAVDRGESKLMAMPQATSGKADEQESPDQTDEEQAEAILSLGNSVQDPTQLGDEMVKPLSITSEGEPAEPGKEGALEPALAHGGGAGLARRGADPASSQMQLLVAEGEAAPAALVFQRDGRQAEENAEDNASMHLEEANGSHLLNRQGAGQDGHGLRSGQMIDPLPDAGRLRKAGSDLKPVGKSADFKVEIALHTGVKARSEISGCGGAD